MSVIWEDIAPRTRTRLEAAGVHDMPALLQWLAENPNGTDAIGRVMMTEMRSLLADPAP